MWKSSGAVAYGTITGDSQTLRWTKSSYSSNDGPQCIEVAAASSSIHVRDSKDVARPGFAVSATDWAAFTAYAAMQDPCRR